MLAEFKGWPLDLGPVLLIGIWVMAIIKTLFMGYTGERMALGIKLMKVGVVVKHTIEAIWVSIGMLLVLAALNPSREYSDMGLVVLYTFIIGMVGYPALLTSSVVDTKDLPEIIKTILKLTGPFK